MEAIIHDLLAGVNDTVRSIMKIIDRKGWGIALLVDDNRVFKGLVTDGDIRRAIMSGFDIDKSVESIMNSKPAILHTVDINKNSSVKANLPRNVKWEGNYLIPVLDSCNRVVGVVSQTDFENNISMKCVCSDKIIDLTPDNKAILIVGGGGYLGSVLVGKLLKDGYRVRVLDLLLFGRESVAEFVGDDRFELIVGDMRNIETVTQALDGVDAVVHLAAIVGDPACRSVPSRTVETNYLATKMLAEACKYHQVNRFVYASTCSVYGMGDDVLNEDSSINPLSLYARTKIQSEVGILSMTDGNFSPCAMRMATLHGLSPRMRFDLVVNTLSMNAAINNKVIIHGGRQWRPVLHVEDAANAFCKCLKAPLDVVRGQIFNVGSSSQNFRIIELGELVAKIIPGTQIVIEENKEDVRDYRVSFEKIEKSIGFHTEYTVEDSMRSIIVALKEKRITDVNNAKFYNYYEG